jgi:hypothetical protein
MIPILATVVVMPAIKGNAPQTPHPIAPKKNNFLYSFFKCLIFLNIVRYVKGSNIKKTKNHLQKANDMGGTYSTPPLATTRLLAINAG